MATKRHHRKTRVGCKSCKDRRLKCDEQKPSCQRCRQKGIECSFLSLIPLGIPSMTFANHQKECCSPASPPPFVVNTHHDWIRSKLYSQPALPGLTDLTSTSVGEPGLDRTLLRIFAEHTAMSLSDRMRVQRAWSNNVPGLSLSQPFLTGGILALAALHLSKVQQSDDSAVARSYLRMATSKLNESLPVFRGMLETLHSENCNALFIFSTFIVIFLFATASNDCKAHLASLPIYTSLPIRSARRRQNEVEIGSLILFRHVQTLQALRGPLYIIEAFFPLIEKGPCSDICSRDYWPKDPISAAVEKVKTGTRISDALLVSLQELWADEVTDVQRTLDKVLEDLRFSYALVMDLSQDDSGTTDSTRSDQSVFVNNQQAPPPVLTDRAAFLACPTIKLLEFVDLVGQHHKAAMVLLLYYAVLLDRVGDYWWSQDTGKQLALAVALVLGPGSQEWLELPMESLGLKDLWLVRT